MARRRRQDAWVTVQVDPALLEVAHAAVAAGRVASVGAWVSRALVELAAKERPLLELMHELDNFQTAHGAFTKSERKPRPKRKAKPRR